MMDQVNRARGEAEAIFARAEATAKGISKLSNAIRAEGGSEAASLRIAEQYIAAFSALAKESTTMLLPTGGSNPASMMAQALSIYKGVVGVDGEKTPMSPEETPLALGKSTGHGKDDRNDWRREPLNASSNTKHESILGAESFCLQAPI